MTAARLAIVDDDPQFGSTCHAAEPRGYEVNTFRARIDLLRRSNAKRRPTSSCSTS